MGILDGILGGDQSQTTTANPWAPSQDYLKQILGGASVAYQKGKGGYVGQTEGQQQALGDLAAYYQNVLPGITSGATGAFQNLIRDPTEVATSQAVKDMIAANTAGITTNLQENILPGIRNNAVGAGQFGGSRQGVAEGVAAGKAVDSANRVAADITGNVYQQALQSQLQGLSMLPMISQAGTAPFQGLYDIGQIERGEAESERDYDWENLMKYAQLVNPIGGMGTSQTTTAPGPSGLSQLAGLASTGLGIYGMGSGFGWF